MLIYNELEQRILDPYKRVLLSNTIGRIFNKLSKGITILNGNYYYIGTGIAVHVSHLKKLCLIKIYLRLATSPILHHGVKTRTCHINPFQHTYALNFRGRRFRAYIKSYHMMIPIGKVKVHYFKQIKNEV